MQQECVMRGTVPLIPLRNNVLNISHTKVVVGIKLIASLNPVIPNKVFIAHKCQCMFCRHRNLRTRRRMHLCMQDDQISPKIVGSAPADMLIQPPSIITKIFLVANSLVCQLGLHRCTLNLPCLTREIAHFY
jgi:hypothetical protein